MAIKKRSTGAVSAAKDVGLGAAFGKVIGYRVKSSADTSISLAVVDDLGRTIATEGSADFTTEVFRNLTAEAAVTEDGTAATGNAGLIGGVFAKSPLTVTPSGVGSGTVTVDFYVEV